MLIAGTEQPSLDEFPLPPNDDKTIINGLSEQLGIHEECIEKLLMRFPFITNYIITAALNQIPDPSKRNSPSNLHKSVSRSDVSTSDQGNELMTDEKGEDWDKETIKASKAT